jgi:hypothetical protein
MSDYPQETMDTLQNYISAQQETLSKVQKYADDMYTTATFYKEQWEAATAEIKVLKGEG